MPRRKKPPPTTLPPRVRTSDDLHRMRSQQVRMMASTKSELKAMAELLGIGIPELRKTFRKELNNGHDYVYAAISQKLVLQAVGGDIRAMLAWMRQFGGWQEVSRREITGKNGEPISFRSLDPHSLAAVIEALGAKGAAGRGPGRGPAQIEFGPSEVIDLDALPGAADEGAGE